MKAHEVIAALQRVDPELEVRSFDGCMDMSLAINDIVVTPRGEYENTEKLYVLVR